MTEYKAKDEGVRIKKEYNPYFVKSAGIEFPEPVDFPRIYKDKLLEGKNLWHEAGSEQHD